jgi:hypothetical protein
VATLCAGIATAQPCGQYSFAYPTFAQASDLALNGDASIVGNALRLTPDAEGASGSAWFSILRVEAADTWATRFRFRLNGTADGFAFVIQNESLNALGSSGSGLGYDGITRSLAVEFDTFSFPGEFPADHVSVQTGFGAPTSSSDSQSLAHSPLPFDLNDNQEHEAFIAYEFGRLRVWVDGELHIDTLAPMDVLFGSCGYVGFTAGSGLATAEQWITSWSFTSGGPQYGDFSTGPILSYVGDAYPDLDGLVLTSADPAQAGAAWAVPGRMQVTTPWVCEFTFRLSGESDGIAFVVQSDSPTAIGGGGSGLGYGSNGPAGIPNSLAVEFDTFSFPGEFPADHVSIQTNYADPNSADDVFSLGWGEIPFDINDWSTHRATIVYDGLVLSVYLNGALITSAPVDFEQGIADGNGEAYVGFTGSTGGIFARQVIRSWNFGEAPTCINLELYDLIPDQEVVAGQRVVLTNPVIGTGPVTYTWLLNGFVVEDGGAISGARTRTLTIDPVGPEHEGFWQYDAMNRCSSLIADFSLQLISVPGCEPDFNQDGNVDQDDIACLAQVVAGDISCSDLDPDFNRDGNVDQDDIDALAQVVAGQECP